MDMPIDNAAPAFLTSNLPQPAATAASVGNTVEFLFRFPPFPNVPLGVEIIPFHNFTEKGIRVQPGGEDNETEMDALGVPTIALGSLHSTDWCKTETRRVRFNGNRGPGKRKKKRTGGGPSTGPTAADWEEYWEEREASYRVRQSYDPFSSAYELLCQGAYDFKSLRPWPSAQKQSGPVFIWGEFLRFVGIPLTSDTNAAVGSAEPPTQKGDNDDSESDMDTYEDDDPRGGIIDSKTLASMGSSMKGQARGEEFLRDPALLLKVFFSSYARDRGIIWTDANLTGAPILIRFFLRFLVDNHILPKREENAIKHESTRRIIELALKELPLTSKLAKVWPDDFHGACKVNWGTKAEVYVFKGVSPEEDIGAEINVEPTAEVTVSGWGNSTDVTDTPESGNDGNPWNKSPWNKNGEALSPTLVTLNVNEDGEVEVDSEVPASGADDMLEPENDWDIFQPLGFFPFLGPTALPLTHATGIIESSVRRIKAVIPPSMNMNKSPVTTGPSADAVEGTVKRTFGIIVFEPWVNWNKGEESHLSMPRILESSRGLVKVENAEDTKSTSAPVTGTLPPFDPYKDDISVIIDPAYIDLFSVGMGCLCTWVQLARIEDLEPQDPNKKKKKNVKTERLWYVEEALRVIPSYYTYLG